MRRGSAHAPATSRKLHVLVASSAHHRRGIRTPHPLSGEANDKAHTHHNRFCEAGVYEDAGFQVVCTSSRLGGLQLRRLGSGCENAPLTLACVIAVQYIIARHVQQPELRSLVPQFAKAQCNRNAAKGV